MAKATAFLFTFIAALTGCNSAESSDEAPAAVRKTASAMLGAEAKVVQESAGESVLYEAHAQTELELVLSASGELRQTEVEIPVASLPAAVASRVQASLPKGASLREAELIIEKTGVVFEVEAKSATGAELEYQIDVSGKLLSGPTSDEDDGDDADDEDDDRER